MYFFGKKNRVKANMYILAISSVQLVAWLIFCHKAEKGKIGLFAGHMVTLLFL